MFDIYTSIEELFMILILCMIIINILLRTNKNSNVKKKEYFVEDLEFWQDYKSEKKDIRTK